MAEAFTTLKELLPQELFECFRFSLMLNTGKEKISDEEVEKYIISLADTSDQQNNTGKLITGKPTFRPAD